MDLRALTIDDLDACNDLAKRVGWLREAYKWRRLLEIGDAVGIPADDGTLRAAGMITHFGDDLAVIGMMMVDPAHRRQGLGGQVLEALLARAEGVPTALYATEESRPLYVRHGFEAVDEVNKIVGRIISAPPLERTIWRQGVDALDTLAAYDQTVIGADRRKLLKPWLEKNVKCVAAIDDSGRIAGYAIVWRNEDVVHIGPVLADDEASARGLIAAGLEESYVTYRIDVPRGQPAIAEWVQQLGLRNERVVPLMVRNGAFANGHPAKLFALGLQSTI